MKYVEQCMEYIRRMEPQLLFIRCSRWDIACEHSPCSSEVLITLWYKPFGNEAYEGVVAARCSLPYSFMRNVDENTFKQVVALKLLLLERSIEERFEA